MTLENGIKVYGRLLEKLVEYVNNGWETTYKVEDVVGVEISTAFILVRFNANAYPIGIEIILK